MKKEPLEEGMTVWIETISSFFRKKEERSIEEYQVVEVNKTSAYIVATEKLDKFNEDPKRHKYLKRRVNLRTHEVERDGFGGSFALWLKAEAFEKNVAYNKEIAENRKQAHDIVNELPLSELKTFISKFAK